MGSIYISNVTLGPLRTQSNSSTEVSAPSIPAQRQTSTENGKAQPQETQPVVMNEAKLNEEIERLNEHVQQERRDLHFSVDEQSGRSIIKIIDSQTKEVIREIPTEEARDLAKRLAEGQGLLLPTKA